MCPSANRYWRTYRGRKPTRSPEARAYLAQVRRLYSTRFPFAGPVAVRLDVHVCRGDLDNRIKVTLDALKGIAFTDDKQVLSLEAHRYETGSKTERVIVRIEPWVRVRALDDVRPELDMHARHTDACITELLDPGATCICRPPAVDEPLVGRATPNVVRRKP